MQIVTLLDLYKTGKINKLFSEFNSDESDKKTIDYHKFRNHRMKF